MPATSLLDPPVSPTLDPPALMALARAVAACGGDWQDRVIHDPAARWYERLHVDEAVEVWVLAWCGAQRTELHDHGGSSGAFVVVEGALREHTPTGRTRSPLSSRTIRAGQGRSFGPTDVHDVVHAGVAPAVSIHAYSPPLTSMGFYRLRRGRPELARVEVVTPAAEPLAVR